jgi:DNA-binding CsgD family transcriptional regulator
MANPELLAWRGDEQATQRAADAAAAAAQFLQAADLQRPSVSALALLHLARGRYPDAFEAASRMRADETVAFANEALPTIVEAGLRCGQREAAAAALTELERRATASGTHWALGVLARSSALMVDDDPEPLYRLAVEHLEQTTVISDLARAQLLFGEWLRRQRRRQDARAVLRRAYETFTGMGAPAFADRARIELAATGERIRKQAPASPVDLTPQERQIARLAADGASTQMIATQLFISSHTVAYHLGKAFRKLGVTSRQQLHTVLDH